MNASPYIDQPTIPEGMTIHEYRINRPVLRVSIVRRVVTYVGPAAKGGRAASDRA